MSGENSRSAGVRATLTDPLLCSQSATAAVVAFTLACVAVVNGENKQNIKLLGERKPYSPRDSCVLAVSSTLLLDLDEG